MVTSSEWQGTRADQLRFADRGVGGLPCGCGCCTNGFEPDLLLWRGEIRAGSPEPPTPFWPPLAAGPISMLTSF